MTKENKLALVVGFGLVLLVGILVSDHFSTARKQAAAELVQVSDPVVLRDRQGEPQLLDFQPPAPPKPEASHIVMGEPNPYGSTVTIDPQPLDLPPNTPTANREQPVVNVSESQRASEDVQWVDIGVDANGNRVLRPVQARTPQQPVTLGTILAPGEKSHVVAAGDSMSSICARYYNDRSLVNALARHNGMSDPNVLKAGQPLRIPTKQTLAPSVLAKNDSSVALRAVNTKPAAPKTYTIKDGDTLMSLASKLMGSAGKWEELYEYNKDVLDDPDTMIVGTVIKVPQ